MIYDPKTGKFDADAALAFHKAIAERPVDWAEYLNLTSKYMDPTGKYPSLPTPDDFLEYLETIDDIPELERED